MKKIVVFLSLILCWACSNKKNVTIPPTILQEKKMAAVMADLHLLEATLGSSFIEFPSHEKVKKDTTTTALTIKQQKDNIISSLLKKNNVSPEEYKRSFIFYTAHPELLNEVYKLVLNNLSELQAKVAAEKDPSLKDSIHIKKS